MSKNPDILHFKKIKDSFTFSIKELLKPTDTWLRKLLANAAKGTKGSRDAENPGVLGLA